MSTSAVADSVLVFVAGQGVHPFSIYSYWEQLASGESSLTLSNADMDEFGAAMTGVKSKSLFLAPRMSVPLGLSLLSLGLGRYWCDRADNIEFERIPQPAGQVDIAVE